MGADARAATLTAPGFDGVAIAVLVGRGVFPRCAGAKQSLVDLVLVALVVRADPRLSLAGPLLNLVSLGVDPGSGVGACGGWGGKKKGDVSKLVLHKSWWGIVDRKNRGTYLLDRPFSGMK